MQQQLIDLLAAISRFKVRAVMHVSCVVCAWLGTPQLKQPVCA